MQVAEVCGDNPHLQTYSTVNVRLKCKCIHTDAVIQTQYFPSCYLKTLIIQSDSSLPQFLDREESSVQKFPFNVQPSIS